MAVHPALAKLPTVADVERDRRGPIAKGPTRLERTMADRPLTKIDEQQFKREVWTRDRYRCRCCGRKVVRGLLSRVPERGEVNHLHGRTGDLRYEVRAAALFCMPCHEKFTGRVNAHRLQIIPTKTFTTKQGTFTDATYPVTFREVR